MTENSSAFRDNLKEPNRMNRFEAFFDNINSITETEQVCLRLSCHAVYSMGMSDIRLLFYDFAGSKEFMAIKTLTDEKDQSKYGLFIACYGPDHKKYETINILGGNYQMFPNVKLDWADSDKRLLELFITNATITRNRG